MDFDFLSSVLDEVALEGLDGITLSMLWVRLAKRPNFPIAIDDDSKIFLWECIAMHKDIDIFELKEPRKLVPLYDRYEHIDSELGIVVESPESVVENFPIECVRDGDIRGSCATYKSRVCITSVIRYDDALLMPFSQVNEKWGERIVLVASQRARLLSLIGTETNPLVDLSQDEYCLLERIGRSRYHGEVTQGEGGLLKLKASFCKQLHYYRKKLTLKGLVTKQLHYLKNRKGAATTGSLFHLTRFYVQRKTKMELLMKCMCDILKDKPHNRETSRKLREELNIKESTFKKLFYRHSEFVKMVNIPYREFNPLATDKEIFNCHGQERLVKVVQLVRHCDEGDNIEDEETNEKDQFLPMNMHFDLSKMYHELPLLIHIHRLVQEAGPEGLTSADLGRLITFPKLDVRTLLKALIKKNLIVTILQERGRQKETKYIARNLGDQNEAYSKVKKGEEDISENKVNLINKKRKTEDSNKPLSKNKKVRFDDELDKNVLDKLQEHSSDECNNSDSVDFQKIISEVSEIQSSDGFTGKSPRLLNMTEEVGNSQKISNTYRMTYRKFKRMNMILDSLKASGLSTLTDLQKYLVEKEKEEGYNFKIDKKSTARMIHRLHLAQKLKIFKAILKLGSQKAEIEFVCDNSINISDPSIQVAVEQAKFRFFSLSKDKSKKSDKDIVTIELSDKKDLGHKGSERKLEENIASSLLNYKALRELQVHPKFLRFKTLHKFLYYLVYNYEGHAGDITKDPIVYHESMSWKRFVPPLPSDRRDGWCFLADIYNRMPLSIFAKVVNLRYRIKEFAEYVVDEEKRNYLITHLPNDMLKSLLIGRKYVFAIDDVIKFLCYMGLITYGPQVAKTKDQMYIYVHKKAAVKDTTISTPGYLYINPDIAYEKKTFSFCALPDVEKFWVELENISSNTPLGKYSSVIGKTIAITEANYKPELLETLKHKNFEEVLDIGHVPGDCLGAGGFDSSLFLHSRRNWQSHNIKESEKIDKVTSSVKSTISIQNLLKSKHASPEKRSRLQRLGRLHSAATKDKTLKENFVKKNKLAESTKKSKSVTSNSSPLPVMTKRRRVKFRTVKTRKKKIRTPYLDEKDKAAIEKMTLSRSRCEWSAQEDSFLLLCKVASSFLDPSSRTIVVPYTIVRDLLHEKFPELATNKTSRACQRRVRYMMLNPTTMNNVAVFLGEARQDMELVKDFDKVKPIKSQEEVWKDLFTGVLTRLLEKFTLPAADRCKNISLPGTMETLKQTFEILSPRNVFHHKNNHKNPENEEELKYCNLYALIVSAMAIIHDGTEWSYLLYKLYHYYPEFVLRSVVSRLRTEKVIACKKRSCKKDLKPSLMTTFPYRFSITYENAMNTKFPIKLFYESKVLLDKFKCINNEGNLELTDCIDPGSTTAVMSLVLLNDISLTVKIPDQVILFDSSLSKEARTNIVERMMHSLSDKESDELSRILNDEKEFSLNKVNDQNLNEDQVQSEVKEKQEDTPQTNEVQRSTNASRFALYLLRQELSQPPIERVQHSQDYIVLNSCQVVCHLKSPTSSEVPSDNISCNQDVTNLPTNKNGHRGKILTDGCISEIKASLCAFFPPEAFRQYQNFEEALEIIYDAYSPQTLSNAKCIFEKIFKAGTIGVSEIVIWEKFPVLTGELSLFEHLHLFREALLVVRAGVSSFVYVVICYGKSWVLQSYVMPDVCCRKRFKVNDYENFDNDSRNEDSPKIGISENIEENNATLPDNFMAAFADNMTVTPNIDHSPVNFTEQIYFLPRSWRHPDGTLNKKVFIQLLQTVLSYVIHSPGVSTTRVTDRFSLILQPVQTLELLEILEKACCIVKYYCKKQKKISIFSPPATIFITKNPEPDDVDHLEPLSDAVCNLTRIQEAIV